MNTYKDKENALKKSLEIWEENAQINFNKTKLSNQSSLNAMETALKNSKLNLENAIKTRDITLKQLKNSIAISKNTSSLAYREYSKLFISSPISWVITEILVDIGQDVNAWTPLIKISSLWKNEVEIALSFSEIDYIKTWTKVEINYLWKKLEWNINSISPVADKNLNYKAKVSINSPVNISGNIVEVIIPVSLDKNLISLKNIKVQSEWIGEINVLENNNIKNVLVYFGKFYWDSVEVLWCKDLKDNECNNLDIITNDVSNFDKEKFNIIKK